ncbi:ras association domain-containing protein 9 [Girardinichthys multiradiatus]|uniref:ras association domain-containing protein 9 n=1 Tax=Girardinichthys multiradiatus TaxID=208333 RepID=UPI001FAD167E|nr:ras association domain-containing protein 9 [Girardinichthys multiradiatus]
MAPFGKNFLKARLKNRTKHADPVVGKEIQITVCNEEKVVCGVTKHTTCTDMVQALLEDHKSLPESKRLLDGEPKDFCLVERWRGFERALPPLTRILRLWYAWGDERPFIQFLLVKTCDFVPQTAKKGGKCKGARPKRWDLGCPQYAQPLPVDKQKRMVRKAFRKLEQLHKENKSSPGTEEIERMVQLILNQDLTIREQIHRTRELDLEIEQFQNQAQREDDSESLLDQACGLGLAANSEEQLQKYIYTCNGIKQLEMQVQRHEDFIIQLSQEIDAELRKFSNPSVPEEEHKEKGAAAQSSYETDESFYKAELERLQGELNHSLFSGVNLQNQVADIDKQLMYMDSSLMAKDQECWQLAAQLNSLQIMDSMEEKKPSLVLLINEAQNSPTRTVKLKPSLSPADVTDTDSDTGISSTHSQDSLSPCLDFPPPLDTDV